MQRTGGKPVLWLAELAREKRLTKADRNFHELSCLAEAIQVGGEYDQLNLGCVMVFEVLFRRMAGIATAIAKGAENPDWSLAKHITDMPDPLSLLSVQKETEVHRRAKDRMELEALRARLSLGRGGGGGGGGGGAASSAALEALAAVETGGLPAVEDAGGTRGKALGRARGRGRNRRLGPEASPGAPQK
jgi:hypothetical protein